MKRLWAAMAILVVVTGLCWWGVHTTIELSNELSTTLQEARNAAEQGDFERAADLSNQAEENWRKFHKTLSTFIQHTRLEAIDLSLASLSPLIEHGAVDEFSSECARAAAQIASLQEAELPHLGEYPLARMDLLQQKRSCLAVKTQPDSSFLCSALY